MEEDEIQAKQTLLQTEIIEKNYDKTAFINFCLSKKENGDDLNNWTLEELTQIVNEFVSSQTQTISSSEPQTDAPKSEGKEGENQEIKKKILKKWKNSTLKKQKISKKKLLPVENWKKLN